ncbi:MAG: terminase family protein [Parvularcula sp.]|jgi:predicted phage terminase large subunit-like protein|nr:terminase family protein [Parvularcula sp.]
MTSTLPPNAAQNSWLPTINVSSENFNSDFLTLLTASIGPSWCEDYAPEAHRIMTYSWRSQARLDQQCPKGNWTTWLVLGGRGAGKTRTGAEWVRMRIAEGARRVALVGETYGDVREVMLDGPSGLLHIGYEELRPRFEPSRRRVIWPGGAEGHIFSAEDPEGLRGFQFDTAWSDELAKWPSAGDTWSNLQMGLRLGSDPRQVVTTTPRNVPLLKEVMGRKTTVMTHASTYANRPHLADSFLTEIAAVYEGTALGRQELLGELIEDREGALWTWPMIEAARGEAPSRFDRVVVAVDPPVTSHEDSDACGIVVAASAKGEEGRQVAWILKDATVRGLTPAGWATRIAALYDHYQADRVVAEVNQGGDLVSEVLRAAAPGLPLRAVRASRGKVARAEPVAALYEQGRVRHARPFPELEDQMTRFTGLPGEGSPDRLDAMVWAVTDLLLGSHAQPTVRSL